MSETSGSFVERMLDRIDQHIENNHRSLVDKILMKIIRRSKEVYLDPMWFIIALKIRHEGHDWDEMDKYREKSNDNKR
ncbi:hypothetical protein LCGC14_1107350 [marine sediment metagenome]|uniref:Uncharacterized protein n=1 Tax=marine sediment metagenome TaxID=412755 RepID=A0A0F9PQY2_9ZZZZ